MRAEAAAVAAMILAMTEACMADGNVLHNGIRLTDPWPPADYVLTLDPPAAPYLQSPPDVIPIDTGRQLFVDDFLIDDMRGVTRVFHKASLHPGNPVTSPDKPWELEGGFPTAMVFSDGVWYDPADRLFKMWYMGGYCARTCYAVSRDGLHWQKPSLDIVPGTNIVLDAARDSTSVILDTFEKDASRRFKMLRTYKDRSQEDSKWFRCVHFSPDGIHWSEPVNVKPAGGDRTTAFYNPFRKVWVENLREYVPFEGAEGNMRCRRYRETSELGADKRPDRQSPLWIGADTLDPRRPELGVQPELYNLDCAAYESLIIGLFNIWPGQPEDRPKPCYIALGFSRDGFHWARPTHDAFIPVSERKDDWNWGNVQSAGGCCLVVGDELYFYFSGRAGVDGSSGSGVCATGLATLRRDGFASIEGGTMGGSLTTRPVTFKGSCLFINADAADGELLAEVLDQNGDVVMPFAREECVPVRSDKTVQQVMWRGGDNLSRLAGTPVRFRFWLRNARLYSFWVSWDRTGASQGYIAAGGPGYTGPIDTTGGEPH